MRRFALLLIVALLIPTTANAGTAAKDCQQKATTTYGVRSLIRCAAPRLGVSTSKALYIAWRESHDQPWAQNSHSSACGVYQFVSGTWRYVVGRFVYGHSLGTLACTNGRASVILALRYVRAGGWGPWGG